MFIFTGIFIIIFIFIFKSLFLQREPLGAHSSCYLSVQRVSVSFSVLLSYRPRAVSRETPCIRESMREYRVVLHVYCRYNGSTKRNRKLAYAFDVIMPNVIAEHQNICFVINLYVIICGGSLELYITKIK